jgi:hypothetical protein
MLRFLDAEMSAEQMLFGHEPSVDCSSRGRSDMEKPAKNTICLWYDGDAEDAARFYAETFPDSSVGAVHRAPGDYPSGKEGDVLTVELSRAMSTPSGLVPIQHAGQSANHLRLRLGRVGLRGLPLLTGPRTL